MKRENFTIIILIIVDITLCTNHVNANENFCTSTECIHASASILERINADVNPCDNFYDFACGTFIDDTLVPDERVSVDVFGQFKDNIDQQLNSFIQNRPANGLYKLICGLYDACMNNRNKLPQFSSEDHSTSLEELRELTRKLGGWPLIDDQTWDNTKWSMDDVIQKIRKIFGNREDKIFDISSSTLILQHANIPSIRLSQAYSKYQKAFRKYIREAVLSLGNKHELNEQEIDEFMDFEYKLNKLNYRLQQLSSSLDLRGESKEFLQILRQLQWLDFFHPSQLQVIHVNSTVTKSTDGSAILNEMKNLLNSTSLRTQANFLIWRLVDYAGSQVTGSVKFSKFQFERAMSGKQDMEQSWKECINVVQDELPYAAGWHFTKGDDFNIKNSAVQMFSDIKYEFSVMIKNSTSWIDEVLQEKLLRKLENLTVLIGYPNKSGFNESEIIKFYGGDAFDKNQYIRTLLQLRIIDADNKFRQTYTSTAIVDDVDNWKKYLPPTSLAAVYSEFENSLRISYSIMMNIINQDESLKYLNYGTIGFIIGHEISHIVNQYINQANTWPEKFRNDFTAKRECVVKQYDSYQDPETLKNLDGKRIVSENIADLTGIKLAYGAYQRWDSKFNATRHKLIGISFTENQLFWISMAQNWCGVFREEELDRKISSDIYATERFRVIGMVENSPDFFNDFKCSDSTQMNRANKCVIW